MLVPVQGRRNNPVLGIEQKPPRIEHAASSNKVVFTWDNLATKHAGPVDIQFVGSVELTGEGLIFSGKVINGTTHVVETVSWPCLGEVCRPVGTKRVEALHLSYFAMTKNSVYL